MFFFVLDPPKTSTFVKVELNYRKAQKQGKNQGVPEKSKGNVVFVLLILAVADLWRDIVGMCGVQSRIQCRYIQ